MPQFGFCAHAKTKSELPLWWFVQVIGYLVDISRILAFIFNQNQKRFLLSCCMSDVSALSCEKSFHFPLTFFLVAPYISRS